MMFRILFFTILLAPSIAIAATINEEIQEAISEKLNIENVYVSMNGKDKIQDYESVIVKSMDLNDKTKKFKAVVVADGRARNVVGSYEMGNLMPVLKDAVAPGTQINENHIAFINIPASKDIRKYHTSAEDMEGKIAKKRLFPNQLVNMSDLASPTIIQKGSTVKMQFNKANLAIEAQGIALEGGGKDDYIKVKNLSSNKVLKAKVVDEGTVSTGG